MKLVDLTAQHRVVEFTNERESHVFATTLARPAYRSRVTSRTALAFYEAPAGQPQALRTWFYPGESDGQEFVYPHGRIAQIAAVPQVAAPPAVLERSQPAIVPEPAPESTESSQLSSTPEPEQTDPAPAVEIAQAIPPAEPTLLAQNTTPAADRDVPAQPDTLPHTASKLPGIAMLGLVSLGAAAAARSRRRSLE